MEMKNLELCDHELSTMSTTKWVYPHQIYGMDVYASTNCVIGKTQFST